MVRCSQKGHLAVTGGPLVLGLCEQGKGFSPFYAQLAQLREVAKFTTFPASSASDFPGSVLSFSLSLSNLLPSRVTMENEMPVPFKLSAE